MQKENAEKAAYTALLNAVPKYDGSTSVDAFLTSLDKQVRDSEVPLDKHLSILEHCLKGKALETYWSMIESEERFDYKSAKESLLKCMGTPLPRKIDQVGMIRYGKDESINDICEESLKHVESFLATLDSKKDIKMKWILSRTLAKCRPECADEWNICPKSVTSLIVALKEWEQKYGSCRKVFTKKFGVGLVSINSKLIGNHTAALRVVVEATGTCTQMSRSNRRKIKVEGRIVRILMSDVTPVVNWVTLRETVPRVALRK